VGALVISFVAAVMGRVLFAFHSHRGSIPKALMGMHAAAAITAFLLLLLEILTTAG
jgi:hypothetical protein